MPLTVGIFPDKIFVPMQWADWSSGCQKMILHHELAHIKRRDGFVQLLQILVQAVFFFHPLIWILNTRINQYREMACDDASVSTKKSSNVEYSRYLVKIAEQMTLSELGCSSVSALIRQRNELLNRVQYQIMEVNKMKFSNKKMWFIVGVLLLLIVPFSWSLSKVSENLSVTESNEFALKSGLQQTGKIVGVVTDVKRENRK